MCSCNKAKRAARAAPSAPAGAGGSDSGPAAARIATFSAVSAEPELPTVDTSVWGALLWKVLHTASVFTSSVRQTKMIKTLLSALLTGLPCPDCSDHYNAWYRSHPLRYPIIGSRISLPVAYRTNTIRWILALHNDVNQRIGSGGGSWSLEQVVAANGSKEDALTALSSLQGVIGPGAYAAASALLQSL